jgi:hypothetical protein
MRRWQKVLPFVISGGLLAWLLSRVSPSDVARAASQLNWPVLSVLTAVMVLALFFWDALCLKFVYVLDDRMPSYRQMLRVRGMSYLAGAFNYELGQGFVAWSMARLQSTTLLHSLSRGVLLAYHDLLVLLSVGLAGSLAGWLPGGDERAAQIGKFCLVGLSLLLLAGCILLVVRVRFRERLVHNRWTAWLGSWRLAHSPGLLLARLGYFAILIVYGYLALRICGIPVSGPVALRVLPLVLVADGLPSFAGLGTREAALLLLLAPPRPETLLAMSLFWSSGMIVGRLFLGLGYLWIESLKKR